MDIKVLFNNISDKDNLCVGWGLSFLLNNRILFDTGEKGSSLLNNINKMNVNPSLIESIVLSHDHWDHTGGLWDLLKKIPDSAVYSCPGFGPDFKQKISGHSKKSIEVAHFTRIDTGIYSTGEMIGNYKGENISEQALIIKTEKGFSVLTGCAHPGIIEILEKVKASLSIEKFYAVLGGFHLKNKSIDEIKHIVKSFVEMKVGRVGATHCSGTDAENLFRNQFGNSFMEVKAGQVIKI